MRLPKDHPVPQMAKDTHAKYEDKAEAEGSGHCEGCRAQLKKCRGVFERLLLMMGHSAANERAAWVK
eukprot:6692976-Pyramimonas_sp.AAC.1